jgi:hypothetical protein
MNRARASASAAAAGSAAARRRGHRGDRRAASTRAAAPQRVDRVGLATPPAPPPLWRGQPRRHPDQPLAGTNQRPLQRPRDVPAALERPKPIDIDRASPLNNRCLDRAASPRNCATQPIDGDGSERVLMDVQPDHDHGDRLLTVGGDRRADRPQSRQAARLLSGHARRSREGDGDTRLARRRYADIRESSQPPPSRVSAHDPTTPTEHDIELWNVTRAVAHTRTESIESPATEIEEVLDV